ASPEQTNARAVFAFMVARPGKTPVKARKWSIQPASTKPPVAATRIAIVRARNLNTEAGRVIEATVIDLSLHLPRSGLRGRPSPRPASCTIGHTANDQASCSQ